MRRSVAMKTMLVALCVAACATPYQPMGTLGGYEDQDLGGGEHSIHVVVNAHTDGATATEYAYRRAKELCADGFDVVDRDKSESNQFVTGRNLYTGTPNGVVSQQTKTSVELLVRCRDSAPIGPDPDARPPARKIVYGDAPMWCAINTEKPVSGLCSADEQTCNDTRKYVHNASECEETKAASCFNYVNTIDESKGLACAPTIEACEASLAHMRTLPDYKIDAMQCGIYRQRGSGE